MIEKVCIICDKKFLRKKSQIILGGGKFCSNQCRFTGRKNGNNVLCSSCGVEIYRSLNDLNGSKSGKYFCSKKCLFEWIYKKHDGHPNWKGGAFSYRQRLSREKDVKICCILCKEKDSRMLAVHHLDKNRLNNSIGNLAWLCHNCHFLVHHYKKENRELNQVLYGKKV